MKTNFESYISDDNLAPDYIIDSFFNRIKKLLITYKKDENIIKKELKRLEIVNGKIPTKIKNLLNDN
jgi:hypothetical protein